MNKCRVFCYTWQVIISCGKQALKKEHQMKLKFFRYFPVVLPYLVLAILVLPAWGDVVAGPAQIFELEYVATYTNHHGKTADIEISMPVPIDGLSHQKVLEISYSPVPNRKEIDSRGDRLIFRFENTPPGESVQCRVSSVVENHRVIHLTDQDKITDDIPRNVRSFLRNTRRYPTESPPVKEVLSRIISPGDNRYMKVQKIYDFIRQLDFQLSASPKSVEDVLRTGTCQCSDASDLMITMCRSAGIPARFAGGIYLKEIHQTTPETHAWVEVYLAPYGWLPADPTMGRFNFFTRLSRFLEIDSPYLLLWRKHRAPYGVYTSHGPGREEFFSLNLSYQARHPRRGVPATAIYPAFNLDISPMASETLLPDDTEARKNYLEGLRRAEAGEISQSREFFNRTIAEEPGFLPAYLQLFGIYSRSNNLDSLSNKMNVLRDKPRARGPAYVVLGLIHQGAGRNVQAHEAYQKARQAGVESPLLDVYHGDLMLQLKQLPEAVAMLNRAIETSPSHLPAYSVLFDLLNYLEDYPSTIQLSRLGMKVRPMADFNYQMARAYFHLQQYAEAEKQAQIALDADSGYGSFLGLMGRIYLKTHREQQGRELIIKALATDMPPDERAELKEVLEGERE